MTTWVNVLASASEEMGVSVDEVISGIKSDPEDAARLIILASETGKARTPIPNSFRRF